MPRVRTVQSRFTQGELDPKMLGRSDIEQYYGAASSMLNVIPIPQGGFSQSPGLEHIGRVMRKITRITSSITATAPNGGTASQGNDNNTSTEVLTTGNISTTNPYVILKYDLGSAKSIEMVRIIGARLTTGSGDDFVIQVSTDDSTYTTVGTSQSLTTSDITFTARVHDSVRYIRFARIGDTDLSTAKAAIDEMHVFEAGDLSDSRIVDFEFNTDQTYTLVFTDKNIAVYREGVYKVDIDASSPEIAESYLNELNWTQSADTVILVQEDMEPKQLVRGDSDTEWTLSNVSFDFIPKYDFVPAESQPATTLTPGATEGTTTLTAGSSVFTTGHVNQYIEGNGGRARIVSYTSGTVVTAVVEIPFYDTNAIASGAWDLLTGFEDTWSSSRGWPRSVVFYEGRLFFGGSKSRPRTVWGSRVNVFFNFDLGSLQDDEALFRDVGGGKLNKINSMYDGRNLMIFTSGGEWVFLQTLGDPLTPQKAVVKRQTSVGSKGGLKPQEVEGGVYFIQKEGSSVQSFIYDDVQQAYASLLSSKLSSHLVKSPVDFSLRKSTSTEEGSYVLLVNNDGTLTIGLVLVSERITAFVPRTTDGLFKRCGIDGTDMYFVVSRTIDSVENYYLERFNFDHFMDASVRVTSGLPLATFSGLDHLEGEVCKVRADDSNMVDRTVSSGSVTIERDAENSFEIGLWAIPSVSDLPVEVKEIGTALGMKKNISMIAVRLYETENVVINGKSLSFRKFGPSGGSTPLDASPPAFTGVKRQWGQLGWSEDALATISQNAPGRMTVLQLTKKVNM